MQGATRVKAPGEEAPSRAREAPDSSAGAKLGAAGGTRAEAASCEVEELDLNRTLAENGVFCHGGAAGDEPALLLYWTDDLTSD